MQHSTQRAGHDALPPAAPSLVAPALASVRVRLRRARKSASRQQRRIAEAFSRGERHRAFGLQIKFLRSFDVRLSALEEANKGLPPRRRVPLENLPAIAEGLDPRRGTNETIWCNLVDKPNGGIRPIHSFGLQNRALQVLVKRALEPFAQFHPSQYIVSGKGVKAAVQDVARYIEEGYVWAQELDIENCYGSFDETVFPGFLPITTGVAEAVLVSNNENARVRSARGTTRIASIHSLYSQSFSCPRGIPQGSVASPLVAAMLLAPLLHDLNLPEGVRIVNYGDNFLVLARKKSDVRRVTSSLSRMALSCTHAGMLRLKEKTAIRRASYGFWFLGREFKSRHGRLSLGPTRVNVKRFYSKCASLCERISQGQASMTDLRGLIMSWKASFSASGHIGGALAYSLLNIAFPRLPDWQAEIRALFHEVVIAGARVRGSGLAQAAR